MLTEKLLAITLLGAEWVMVLLIGLSVVSVAMMIDRWRFFRRHRIDLSRTQRELADRLDEDDVAGAAAILRKTGAIEGQVVADAVERLGDGRNAVEQTLQGALARERPAMQRYLVFLGTLGNNAPFIGLFGTVVGVIKAFHDLGLHSEGGAAVVMGGISEALVATGVGLVVALPAVAAHNYFQARADDIANNADVLGREVLARTDVPRAPTSGVSLRVGA